MQSPFQAQSKFCLSGKRAAARALAGSLVVSRAFTSSLSAGGEAGPLTQGPALCLLVHKFLSGNLIILPLTSHKEKALLSKKESFL